jgi:hypothetical protein
MKNIAKTCFFMATVMLLTVAKIYAQVSVGIGISANIAPPALPVYVQPPCPVDGYLWEPGYWAYDPDIGGYYWVPGVWVAPPTIGFLWTPCYWGFSDGVYLFHEGYWGPDVGFYGGINYGCGYYGVGFAGGEWRGNRFRYNTAAMRVNSTVIRNTYADRSIITRNRVVNNRVSYNGGRGGVSARPHSAELQAMRERHIQPTRAQLTHQQAAKRDRSQFASVNHGRPAIAAMNRLNGNRFTPQGRPATPKASGHMSAAGNRRSSVSNARRGNNNTGIQHQRGLANNNAIQRQRVQQQQRSPQRVQQHAQQQQHMHAQQRAQQPRMQQRAYMQPQHMQPRMQQPQRMQSQPRMQQPQRMQPQPGNGGGQPHGRH